MLQSTIHQDDPTKSFKNFVKNTIDQRINNWCQMLTQAINFCKFIFSFFRGSDYLQKICHILHRWKDDSFAAGYLSLNIYA